MARVKPNVEIRFEAQASRPKVGTAVSFDLEGFSGFYSQPDVHNYVTKYLNRVFECMSIIFRGDEQYWAENVQTPALPTPLHRKFLGDGALYLWETEPAFASDTVRMDLLINLWNLKKYFGRVAEAAADDVPVPDVPRSIRLGISQGTIYELAYAGGGPKEYIGYAINLASRLRDYCRELGFIASARVGLPEDRLLSQGFVKVIAKKLKGFPREIVIVDANEYLALPPPLRTELFAEITPVRR